MSRWPWLLGLALCGVTEASAQPRIDVAATPAWNGWTRPERTTEIDVRVSADAATHATLDVVAGRQAVRTELDVEPGRAMRLQVPIGSAEEVAVSVAAPGAAPQRRELRIAQSESPLLGVGIASHESIDLEGFHAVRLVADDLPRNAAAYASIDALILDAPMLGALDRRQQGALLAHAAACGRIVLLTADPAVRHVLDAAAGCAGRAVSSAASLEEAAAMLRSSLAASIAPEISLVSVRDLAQPARAAWNRVLVLVAAYFAIAAIALLLAPSLPVVLLVPAFAAVALLALLHAMQPPAALVVWSEGDSGGQVARYEAWQLLPGLARGRTHVPLPPQLEAARPCEPGQSMRFDFDATRGRLTSAEFDTRLFRQTALCYSGMFPLARAIAVETRPDASLEVRNAGRTAWPNGRLLTSGVVQDVPELEPGGSTIVRIDASRQSRDGAARIALERIRPDGVAALWALDPDDLAKSGTAWKGWLLLTATRR